MNDMFQVDYLPDEKKIKINLPEEVWRNIDTVIMTRQFQEELVVEKQKEIEVEEGWPAKFFDVSTDYLLGLSDERKTIIIEKSVDLSKISTDELMREVIKRWLK